MGRASVQELLVRCAARKRASDSDWTTEKDGVSHRAFPEGMLAKRKIDEVADDWILWWCTRECIRPLNRGPLADIECDTREVIFFGPPGGPDDGSGPRVWCPDEGSLFATTIHGSFRIMVRPGDRGTLIFVRDDFSTLYLGDDSIEELRRTADSRLRVHRGDPIRGWIGGRRIDFHGVGVRGVLGQAELMRDTWLVLVRADEDRFDVYMVVGDQILDRMGSYTGSAVINGDLGQLFDQQADEADEVNDPAPAGGGPRPRRTPPHNRRAPTPHAPRATPPSPATLSADQLGRIDTAFSPTGPFDGKGASEMGAVYATLRVLNTRNLPNMRIKTARFRKLVIQEGKQQLGDCTKTFGRAAERVLDDAKFGARDGHWWVLPFAELRRLGAVVDRICAHFEPKRTPPTEPPASPTAGPAATGHASSTPTPPAEPPVSPTTVEAATGPASSTPTPPAEPPMSPPAAPAATESPECPTAAQATPYPLAEPSASPSPPSTPAPSASSTRAVMPASSSTLTPPVSSTQPSAPSTPAAVLASSPPAPAASLASSIPAAVSLIRVPTETPLAAFAPPLVGETPTVPAPLIHASSPDTPVPPVESGTPSVEVDPLLEANPLEDGDDPAPDESEDDGHWHPVVRQDGQPTFYEPLKPREPSDAGASRFPGIKARGPPKN